MARTNSDGKNRQLAGSERGAEAVRGAFDAVITRKRLCELVGIHATTLRRWERAGVIAGRSEVIMGSPTMVFCQGNVDYARRLNAILRDRAGTLTLAQAAALAHDG